MFCGIIIEEFPLIYQYFHWFCVHDVDESGDAQMRKFGKAVRVIWFLVCFCIIGACGLFVYDTWQGQSFTAYASPYEQYTEYKTGNFRYHSVLKLSGQLLADLGDGTGAIPVDLNMDMLYDGFMSDPYEHGYLDMKLSFLGLEALYASELYQDASGDERATYVRVSDGVNHGDWMRSQQFSPFVNIPRLIEHELFTGSSIEETDDGYVIYADAERLINILDLKGILNETLTSITGDVEAEAAFKTAAQSASAKYIFDKHYRLVEVQLLDFMYYTNSFAVAGVWDIVFYDFDKVLTVDARVPDDVKAAEVANDENVFWSFTDSVLGQSVMDQMAQAADQTSGETSTEPALEETEDHE